LIAVDDDHVPPLLLGHSGVARSAHYCTDFFLISSLVRKVLDGLELDVEFQTFQTRAIRRGSIRPHGFVRAAGFLPNSLLASLQLLKVGLPKMREDDLRGRGPAPLRALLGHRCSF